MRELAKNGGIAADLAIAFEASPNPYILITPDLHIAGMNQAYLDITHSDRNAILGRPLFAAFDSGPGNEAPENVRRVRASLEKARDTRARDHLALVRFSVARETPAGPVFEDRFWSATHTPILDADGEVIYLLQHTTDVTKLERLRAAARTDALSSRSELDAIFSGAMARANRVQEDNRRLETERNRLFEIFMQAPGFVAVLGGPEHRFQMANDAYLSLVGRRDILGKVIREALPDLAGQGFYELLDSVLATGEPYEGRGQSVELQRGPGGLPETRHVNFVYQPIRGDDGHIVGIFVQGNDVTDATLAAERQKLMIDELNHRVKNTLATVQSIAMQTARSHPDPQTFAESFQARLISLSHTHDLLTRSHWEGADLRAVLEHETEAHGGPSRITAVGPPVALPPASALSMGMIFHELSTNAAKYGALSVPEGRIQVDWRLSDQRNRSLEITWLEVGGPSAAEPQRKGFGTRLIERNVRHDLAGQLSMRYEASGFSADFAIPLDREIP